MIGSSVPVVLCFSHALRLCVCLLVASSLMLGDVNGSVGIVKNMLDVL